MTQVRLCLLVFRRSGAKHLPPPLHIYFYLLLIDRVKTIHKYLDFRWHVCIILQVHTTYIFAEIKLLVVKIAKTPSDLPIRTMDIKLPLYCYEHASEHKKIDLWFRFKFCYLDDICWNSPLTRSYKILLMDDITFKWSEWVLQVLTFK